MTYAAIYTAATDAAFQGRCLVAAWKAAQDITDESDKAVDHAARLNWARKMLQDRASITPRQLAIQVLRNATIAGDPSAAADGDLQFQVNSIIADLVKIG